jgi:pimeloyl-ACP methyl ester carboxylesterase
VTAANIPGFVVRHRRLGGSACRWFTAGEGEPLVLVHGLGGAASNWRVLAPLLARRSRVIVPDLPGHGASEPPLAAPSLAAYADRVGELIEQEATGPAAVVGHSFGASVALRLALRRPEAVRAVVLAGAAGISSRRRAARLALPALAVLRPGRVACRFRKSVKRYPRLRGLVFGGWGAADPAALADDAVDGLLEPAALHRDTLSAALAVVRDDPRTELGRLRCPRLVLWGARDGQVPVADAFEYARRLRAELRVIAGCGHLLIAERPDACCDAIEGFLHRVRQLDELPVEPEALRQTGG